ncbi:hypothetical protein BT69DRAFT_1282630 [Atractiella rhizophila]|nr:hypothetical protein BT69DRAFT_1282630 [Atractiella rhizophila]
MNFLRAPIPSLSTSSTNDTCYKLTMSLMESTNKKNREKTSGRARKKSRRKLRRYRNGGNGSDEKFIIPYEGASSAEGKEDGSSSDASNFVIIKEEGAAVPSDQAIPMEIDFQSPASTSIRDPVNLINIKLPYEILRLIFSYVSDPYGFPSEHITLSKISSVQTIRRRPPVFCSGLISNQSEPTFSSTVVLPSWYDYPLNLRSVCQRWKYVMDALSFRSLSVHHAARVLSLHKLAQHTNQPFTQVQYLSIRLLTKSRASLKNLAVSYDLDSPTANIAQLASVISQCQNLRRLELAGIPLGGLFGAHGIVNTHGWNLTELLLDSESSGEGHMDSYTFGEVLESLGKRLELLKVRGWSSEDAEALDIFNPSLPNLRALKITDSYPSIKDLIIFLNSLSPSALTTLELSQFRLPLSTPLAISLQQNVPTDIPIYLHPLVLPALLRLAPHLHTLSMGCFNFPLPDEVPSSQPRLRRGPVTTPQRLASSTPLPLTAPPPIKDACHPSRTLARVLEHCTTLSYLTLGGNISTIVPGELLRSIGQASEGKNLRVLRLIETRIKMKDLAGWLKSEECKEKLERVELWTGWESWDDRLNLQLECWKRGTELKVGRGGAW